MFVHELMCMPLTRSMNDDWIIAGNYEIQVDSRCCRMHEPNLLEKHTKRKIKFNRQTLNLRSRKVLKCSPQKTNFPEKSFFSSKKNGFPIGIASVSRLEKAKTFAARRLPHRVSQPVSVYVPKNCFTIESPCNSPQNTCQRLFSLVTSPSVVGAAASTFNRNSILVNHAAVFIMWD